MKMSSAKTNILCLFDVDGTLTKPRQTISDDMCAFLARAAEVATLAVVGGSDWAKIQQQLTAQSSRSALPLFRYIFAENGLVAFKGEEQIGCVSLIDHLGDEFLQKFINFTLRHLSTIELPLKRGSFIEFRQGMINISPIGRSCSQAERESFVEYDREHGVRAKLMTVLQQQFANSDLTFCIGGQISVDAFPRGWDKTYALKFINNNDYQAIHFFGDRTAPGGNDHAIYEHERTIGHVVVDPSDTQRQVSQLLGL